MNPAQVLTVGIQGIKASFHDVAAARYFGGKTFEPLECASFTALCTGLQSGEADCCLMAIENSIAGSILPNYSLLGSHGFKIMGETYLRIEMHLMALPGQRLSDIRFVQSHPMALLQCDGFLAAHPAIKVLESADTAESAKEIQSRQLLGHAAIASKLAAETYGLEVLQAGIESNKQNYTRFLVICRPDRYCPTPADNKSSLRFEVADRPGSLAAVLSVFHQHAINMTKIQSVPILGRPYEYSFYVDLEWDDRSRYRAALQAVEQAVTHLAQFGEYPKGVRPVR